MSRALEGVKVLELGRVFSGPLCGMVLADLGARVLKVERPGVGDESRRFGLHRAGGETCYFNSLNRNKTSVALDLAQSDDHALFTELVREADVLVHNWIQGSLDRLGFSYGAASALNPRLVYCAISGYGPETEFASRPAQDIIAQALSGFMSLTGEADGPPLKSAIPVVDYATGLYAATGIAAALLQRERTGQGQLVTLSLLQTALAMTSFASAEHLSVGTVPRRTGNRHPSICPYNLYATADGWVVLAVANDDMWLRLCRALDLEPDPRFATNRLRLEHQEAVEALLEARIRGLGTDALVATLEACKVSCAQVNDVEQAFRCPPVAGLHQVEDVGGGVRFVGSPLRLHGSEPVKTTAPPPLGAHNGELARRG